jgi:phosphoserine phosphatase RsbX
VDRGDREKMKKATGSIIDWGVATPAVTHITVPDDAYCVKAWKKKFLIALIDGQGHGKRAAEAVGIACATLTDKASDFDDVVSLVRQCHKSLSGTRGVVLSLALFDAGSNTMTWLGVGNVDGLLLRADHHANRAHAALFPKAGVVGCQLPSLSPFTINVKRGDILIFRTEGVLSIFEKEVNPKESPQQIADRIMMNYNKKTDDALVLVARYIGSGS